MRTHIRKWGNSLGLRIPKIIAEEAQIKAGTPVEFFIEDGILMVRPDIHRHELDDLLSGITPENVHDEIDTGRPVGREAW